MEVVTKIKLMGCEIDVTHLYTGFFRLKMQVVSWTTLFLFMVLSPQFMETSNVRWPRVLLFGDILTKNSFSLEGRWGAELADRLILTADVMNRGSDFTSESVNFFLNEMMLGQNTSKVAVVTILFGTRDCLSNVPRVSFQKNLDTLVNRLILQYGISIQKMILMCPPPLIRNACNIQSYVDVCTNLGDKLGITTLNLYQIFITKGYTSKLFSSDGASFSSDGSDVVYQHLFPIVKSKIDHFNNS